MYEKPLYPTPDGYRRSSKNPYKNQCLRKEVEDLRALKARLNKEDSSLNEPNKKSSSQPQKKRVQISDKAAKLIALAIKSMLRSK